MRIPEMMPLREANKRLDFEYDELLDLAIGGKIALYAPVLYEGLYEWTVSLDSEGRNRRFLSVLSLEDAALLSVRDIEDIKIRNWVVQDQVVCPRRAIREIEDWKRGWTALLNEKFPLKEFPLSELVLSDAVRLSQYRRNFSSELSCRDPNENPRRLGSGELVEDVYTQLRSYAETAPWVRTGSQRTIDDYLSRDANGNFHQHENDYKVTRDVLYISKDDFSEINDLLLQKVRDVSIVDSLEEDIPTVDESRLHGNYYSARLKALIHLSHLWAEPSNSYKAGKDLSGYRDFHESVIKKKIGEHPLFKGRNELAKYAPEFIRPLFARRNSIFNSGRLFESHHSPELRALCRATKIWDGWTPGMPRPTKKEAVAEIESGMRMMGLSSSKTFQDFGPKILQPHEADTGRESQKKRKKRHS